MIKVFSNIYEINWIFNFKVLFRVNIRVKVDYKLLMIKVNGINQGLKGIVCIDINDINLF